MYVDEKKKILVISIKCTAYICTCSTCMYLVHVYMCELFIFLPQSIPQISSVPYYTTLVPLIIVLLITAIKDGYDDIVSF